MRVTSTLRRLVAAGAACAIGAAVAIVGLAPAEAKKTGDVSCTLVLFATIPQPAATAANYGKADCDAPLGHGVQEDSSTVTRTSPLTGSFTGPFKLYFDRGTISGTYTMAFVTTVGGSPPQITNVDYDGTLEVTGGTGKYKHARGTGTITGNSPDAKKTTLHEELHLTGVK